MPKSIEKAWRCERDSGRFDAYRFLSLFSQQPLHSETVSHFKIGVVMRCVLPGTRMLQPEWQPVGLAP